VTNAKESVPIRETASANLRFSLFRKLSTGVSKKHKQLRFSTNQQEAEKKNK
jgi:hypothetical protein